MSAIICLSSVKLDFMVGGGGERLVHYCSLARLRMRSGSLTKLKWWEERLVQYCSLARLRMHVDQAREGVNECYNALALKHAAHAVWHSFLF